MGKGKKTTVGYWYKPAFHAGLGVGPIDALLEFRCGDKPAWTGALTASGSIHVDAPELFGGEKDQGGIVGDADVMFGEAGQMPNGYLSSTFGAQQPAWRGLATFVWKGGKYGAMNPYPKPPAYKLRKVKQGWADGCWYSETAAVLLSGSASGDDVVDTRQIVFSGYHVGFMTHPDLTKIVTDDRAGQHAILHGTLSADSSPLLARIQLTSDDGTSLYADTGWYGYEVTDLRAALTTAGRLDLMDPIVGTSSSVPVILPAAGAVIRGKFFIVRTNDGVPGKPQMTIVIPGHDDRAYAMNPAHILYYSRTQPDMAGEPTSAINAASFTAAADWFYAQGFGLCTSYDPSKESVDEFEQRICRVAGCSLSRSLIDGQWYIDIANGEYDIDTLPILTDDDILSFEEQPAILDGVTNSVSIKYFDPEKKEAITTPPVQAPALIQDFGTIHKTIDFQEIPTDTLASRVALRELQAAISAPKGYKLSTTRAPYAWRPGTYFRLQLAKRGIADMVCYFAEKNSGTLRSGAMAITATQDVYSLPSTSFVENEPGVDTRPDQTPQPITLQAAFEAPYTEVCAALPRAELEVLPSDVGYLMAVAADPSVSRDYTLMVNDGAGYEQRDYGEWCGTALVVEASGYLDTAFTLSGGVRLTQVLVGQPALWGSEIVRVDAIDATAGTITLARACADTVPAKHAAGERIWFWQVGVAYDTTEYTDGEAVNVKLLTNTGSQRLPITSSTALTLTFDQRQFRPYPPAGVTINSASFPGSVTGDAVISAVARNRVTQADQLVDWTMATIAAEAGTTYSVRNVDVETDTQTHLTTGITAWPHTIPAADLRTLNRVEVWSVRDSVESWQRVQIPFTTGTALLAESGDAITTEDGDAILME
ncbi:MAG: hypothetical protein K8F33_08930 [Thermomonas sp.]|uniref:hypothetical protein n=1 Tax=Thermomonas sp. TaxID=1971895 RepID=UPI001DF964F3|nr:hypothetical protein [Thermomonas sp.]MBZ0088205.1 hypothetical protein [Thermomonas sp.]